jgi:hypothetical protein
VLVGYLEPMLRKSLAALLILSWVVLSGFDLLEDLEFKTGPGAYSEGTPDKTLPPHFKHRVSPANNIVESAHIEQLFHPSLLGLTAFRACNHSVSSFCWVSELYKLHRVFLI